MVTTSNYFSGILRRLLCSGAEHPSDAVVGGEFNHYQDSKTEKCGGDAKPGIVARLMGLDSLPETVSSTVPRRRTFESILHSRSLNSINYLPETDQDQDQDHQHRRVKTSVSLREFTTFIDDPSYDIFLLCLEGIGVDENGRPLSVTKSDMGLEEKFLTEKTRGGVRERSKEVESMKVVEKNKKCSVSRKSETENETRLGEGSSMELQVSSSRRRRRARKDITEYEYPLKEEEEDMSMKSRKREASDDEDSVKVIDQILQIDCDSDWFEEIEAICNELGQKLLDDMFEKVVDELNMD